MPAWFLYIFNVKDFKNNNFSNKTNIRYDPEAIVSHTKFEGNHILSMSVTYVCAFAIILVDKILNISLAG